MIVRGVKTIKGVKIEKGGEIIRAVSVRAEASFTRSNSQKSSLRIAGHQAGAQKFESQIFRLSCGAAKAGGADTLRRQESIVSDLELRL